MSKGADSEASWHLSFRCARKWSELAQIEGESTVRYCDVCRAAVHRVRTEMEFDSEASAGRCVAVDLGRGEFMIGDPVPRGGGRPE